MNWINYIAESANVKDLEISLDKFIKYANHLAIEFLRDPWLKEWDRRGWEYVSEIIDLCYSSEILSENERDDFYSWDVNIEEVVIRILEILIEEWYFIVEDYWISDSTNPISFVYAWNTYKRLWKSLWKWRIEIPPIYIDNGMDKPRKPLQITQEQSKNSVGRIISDGEETSSGENGIYEVPKKISEKLFYPITQALKFENSEKFDKNTFIQLLKKSGLIWDKEEWFLRIIDSHTDFAQYIKTILNNNGSFMEGLSPEQLAELERCFYGLDLYFWDMLEHQLQRKNMTKSSVVSMSEYLAHNILDWSTDNITHDYLNFTLDLLEEYFAYKPFYLRILHAELDEIRDLSSEYHKAIQILWIVICDILESSHPLFENASKILLCNTQSKKSHAAIRAIIASKETTQ